MAFDNEEDDIEGDVAAAFRAAEEPEGVVVAPQQTTEPVEAKPEPVRDETGKFAKAPETVQTEVTEPPAATAETPQESIRPPAAWSATAKAKFLTLDPDIQAEVIKRERDMDRGLSDRATQLKRYEPLESVIGPVRDRLALAGTDEATYVRSLIAADEMLRNDPQNALQQIARMYNIPLGAQAQGQPQAQPDPASYFGQQIQTLAQRVEAFERQQVEARQAETQSAITAFANDPAHVYFENVKPAMAGLLQSGQAEDLKQAYDMACWANPEVRGLLIAEQTRAATAQTVDAAKQKAALAKNASGSVAGSGGHGDPAPVSSPNSTIEDDVRQAFAATSGRI